MRAPGRVPAENGDTLRFSVRGATAWLTLNRPEKLNALSVETLECLCATLAELRKRSDIEVLVLSGSGRAFSSGLDLNELEALVGSPPDFGVFDAGKQAVDELVTLPQVTLAAIHGRCIGGAVVLAAACDLRVSTSTAVFSTPELDLGLPLAWGGVRVLWRELGPAPTRELLLGRRAFTGSQLEQIGFLRTADDDSLLGETEALTRRICEGRTAAARLTKVQLRAADAAVGLGLQEADDRLLLRQAATDPAARRALRAYLGSYQAKATIPPLDEKGANDAR